MTSTPASTTNRVVRVFVKDSMGKPVCGTGNCMLGARVPTDIKPDADGTVHPNRGGMSVTPEDPARLPLHFRPIALGGAGVLPVFGIEVAQLGSRLQYTPDPKKPTRHGWVEPSVTMLLEDYQAALAATAPVWKELA